MEPSFFPTEEPTFYPTTDPTKAPWKDDGWQPDGWGNDGHSKEICITRESCNDQRLKMGYSFLIGSWSTKGCYSIGTTVYWSRGGDLEDRKTDPLSGQRKRVYCGGSWGDDGWQEDGWADDGHKSE